MKLFISLLFIGTLIGLGAIIGKGTPEALKTTPAPDSSLATTTDTPTMSPEGQLETPSQGGGAPTGRLFYLTRSGSTTEIQSVDVVTKIKKTVFSDKNSDMKIQYVSKVSRSGDSIVALLSKVGEDAGELTAIKTDGSKTKTVLAKEFISTAAPALSPDNTKLVLVSFSNADPNFGFTLTSMNVDGSAKKSLVTDESGISSPVFSPDGQKIAFIKGAASSNNGIIVYDFTTSKSATLYENKDKVIEDFDWSSIGLLSVTAAPSGKKTASQSEVYVIDPNSKNIIQTTKNSKIEQSPAIAPDASGIGYIQLDDKGTPGISSGDITVSDAEGKNPVTLGKAIQLLGWIK